MATDFNAVIDEFVSGYGFSRMQVICTIEKIFSEMLSRWHRVNVTVMYNDGRLRAFGYFKSNGYCEQREIDLQKPDAKGWKTVKRIIEQNMQLAANNAKYYQASRASMMGWGTISNIVPGDKLIVELTLADKFANTFEIYAECPILRIGRYERLTSAFAPGMRRAFWVRAIHPVTISGTPRLNVTLNRTSKNLPAMLLKEKMTDEELTVRCLRRYPGQKSFLATNKPVPRETILDIENELHEHVCVKYAR